MTTADFKATDRIVRDGPTGLGGWLVLPMLGMFGTIYVLGSGVYLAFSVFPNLLNADPAIQVFAYAEAAVNAIGVLFVIYLLMLFFKRDERFPRFYIYFSIATLIVLIVDPSIGAWLGIPFDDEDIKAIMRAIISSAIWIPYMLKSKRVRNTFAKPYFGDDLAKNVF